MMVEFILQLLSAQHFNRDGNIISALGSALVIASVFAAIAYRSSYLVNREYHDVKVLGIIAFLSFLLTLSSVIAIWLLRNLDSRTAAPFEEAYGYSVFHALLVVISVYIVLQAVLIGLAVWLAHKDIKVFR